jgi:hypothetical protein
MAITDFLFPQGNFLNIRSNSPNQRSYNIDATADLARNLPGGFLKDLISPAVAATLSLPYDTIQGIGRAVDKSNVGTSPYRGIVDDMEIPSGPSLSDIGQAINAENPLSSAYERFIGASAPLAERISNISNPFKMSQAAASEVDLSNRNINTTEPYQDLIMNPDNMPNRLQNLERFADNRFEDSEEIPGFNFIDAPTSLKSRITNPQFLNNPNRGIIDNLILSRGNPDASLVNKTKNAFKNITQFLPFGEKSITGSLLRGITSLLPERDYRQKTLEDFYGNIKNGTIQSGLMAGYNPVSGGGLYTLSGGQKGEPPTYGLGGAIDKRIARIQKTLKKKKSAVLEQRIKDLQALKAREAKALEDARAKQAQALESQRRGRRPTAPTGGGTRDDQGDRSKGQTGGYSYDSGGRQGFGYGL